MLLDRNPRREKIPRELLSDREKRSDNLYDPLIVGIAIRLIAQIHLHFGCNRGWLPNPSCEPKRINQDSEKYLLRGIRKSKLVSPPRPDGPDPS